MTVDSIGFPSFYTNNRQVKIIFYFVLIAALCIIVSVTLVIGLSRDHIESREITDDSWALRKPKNPSVARPQSSIDDKLTKMQQDIWADYQNSPNPYSLAPKTSNDVTHGIVLLCIDFESSYELIKKIRDYNNILPIELWHKTGIIHDDNKKSLKDFKNIICRNMDELLPINISNNQDSQKIISMFLSSFDELIYLDSFDNIDLKNLFESYEYKNFNVYITDSTTIVINKLLYYQQLWCIFRILEESLDSSFRDSGLFEKTWAATGIKI